MVLRTVGLSESTYYDRKKQALNPEAEEAPLGRKGRPVPGFSYTQTGEKISDEQIKEWLLELIEGEEHVYGYKLLAVCLRKERGLILDKKKAFRTIIDQKEKQKRDTEATRQRRREAPRHTYLTQAAERRTEAHRMREEGLKIREVAEVLGITEGAVKMLLQRKNKR
jgi:putative transposase